MAVVRTKLEIPPLAPWILSRERLLLRLSGGGGGGKPVVLVSAPAGYGKTSLLACWARSRPGPTAWLALDREDDDPSRLAAAIEAAIEAVEDPSDPSRSGEARPGSAAGSPAAAVLESGRAQAEPVARIVDLLVAGRGLALVLDDVHLLKSRGALGLLSSLIERLPDGVRILLAARSDPRLPLARLRSQGLLEELRTEDLRLGPVEAAALASALGVPALGPEESALLEARTEGWAAGVTLAAMNLAARASSGGRTAAVALLRDTRAAHRWALDYLLEEVLDRVSEETEDFLVRSSVLERFPAPLAEAVVGRPPPGGSLQALAREALFLSPVDAAETWWRYHPLFSELLLVRLRETRPGLEAGLRVKAADWLEGSGYAEEAAAQLLAAGESARAAGLVEAAAEGMMARGEIDALLRQIDALPSEALELCPNLRATRAWCLFFRGSPIAQFLGSISGADAEVLSELGRLYRGDFEGAAERIDGLLEPVDGSGTHLTWAGRYLAYFGSVLARFELGRMAEAEDILGRLRRSESPMLSLGAVFFMASALVRSGELGRAQALLEADLQAYAAKELTAAASSRGPALPALGRHYVLLGEILLHKGRFEESEAALLAGIARLERIGAASSMSGLLLLARLRALRGEESANLMERARKLAADFDFTDLDDRGVLVCEAKIALYRGDRRLARRLLDALPPPPEDPALAAFLERHPAKYERLEKARILAAEGRFDAALSILAALRDLSISVGRPFLLVDVDLLRALALDALGRIAEADAAVEEALSRAAPEGALLPFLESGTACAALLARRLGRLRAGLAAFAATVISAVEGLRSGESAESGASAAGASGGGLKLSSREREVLSFLPSELSAAEIGERLYLSENTVKSHMKTLYAKLDSHSRAAAWARAVELGLAPGRR